MANGANGNGSGVAINWRQHQWRQQHETARYRRSGNSGGVASIEMWRAQHQRRAAIENNRSIA